MNLRVSGAQIPVSNDIRQNAATLRRAIEWAASVKADILLTPEGSLSGYTHEFDIEQLQRGLLEVTALARQHRVGLALGTCFKETDGKVYNQIRFYATDGSYLGFHSKILRCKNMLDPQQEAEVDHFAATEPGVISLGGVVVGGLICNDLWANPAWTPMPDVHLTRVLSEMGARLIFHAVNGGRDGSPWSQVTWQYHEANLRLRARADRLWIVTVDNCDPVSMPCSAPSGVLSPEGDWACQAASQGEQFFVYNIELAK
jgi:predicted amidohydrolase